MLKKVNMTARALSAALALTVVVALIAVTLNVALPVRAQASTGALRFVHALPGASAVDIYVDSVLAAGNVRFGEGTRFLNAEIGARVVSIAPAGTSAPIFQGAVDVTPDLGRTVVVQGAPSAIEVGLYEDELFPVRAGNFRLTAIHAVKGAPAVDLLLVNGTNVTPLIQGLNYGAPFGTLDIPAMAGDLVIVPAGGNIDQAVARADAQTLVAGTYNAVVVVGAASGEPTPSAVVLTAATQAEDPAASALVRLVHASPDGGPVDVYAGGTLLAANVLFQAVTPHVALPAGTLELALRAAGTAPDSAPLLSQSLTLEAGSAVTVVAAGSADTLGVKVYPDNITALDSTKSRVKIINALSESKAEINLGSTVVTSEDEGGIDVTPLAAIAEVSVTDPAIKTLTSVNLSGGVLYDLVVSGTTEEPIILVGATGLSERPGSAVSSAPAVAIEPTAAAPVAPAATTVPEPTGGSGGVFLPTLAPTAVPVVEVQPTERPAVVFQPTPFGKTGWIGIVDTNPGVNLKLREYPFAEAKTLALVPSGEALEIDGIKGPVPPSGQATPVATATVAPSGIIEDLWVFVTWNTPGGKITGWTKPQYLRVSDARGFRVKFEDYFTLPLIAENEFGQIDSTSATPVSEDLRVVATVTVDPGVNLQLRRTPGIDSESLTLLPAGAQLTAIEKTEVKSLGGLVGEPESTIWIFVRFDTESGRITGWVNSQFISLTFRGKPYELKDLPTAKEIRTGSAEGNVVVVTPPPAAGLVATVDKVNPGVNLQFRRTPDPAAESLGLIPFGSQVPVLGRNGSGAWLLVQFNGQEGWINADFVTVTRDGKRVKIEELKNVTEEADVTLTPAPTVTPAG